MINVLGETYYIDLDLVEEYVGIPSDEETMSGETSEIKMNIIKFDLVKMLLDTVLTEHEDGDETLGMKQSSDEIAGINANQPNSVVIVIE